MNIQIVVKANGEGHFSLCLRDEAGGDAEFACGDLGHFSHIISGKAAQRRLANAPKGTEFYVTGMTVTPLTYQQRAEAIAAKLRLFADRDYKNPTLLARWYALAELGQAINDEGLMQWANSEYFRLSGDVLQGKLTEEQAVAEWRRRVRGAADDVEQRGNIEAVREQARAAAEAAEAGQA